LEQLRNQFQLRRKLRVGVFFRAGACCAGACCAGAPLAKVLRGRIGREDFAGHELIERARLSRFFRARAGRRNRQLQLEIVFVRQRNRLGLSAPQRNRRILLADEDRRGRLLLHVRWHAVERSPQPAVAVSLRVERAGRVPDLHALEMRAVGIGIAHSMHDGEPPVVEQFFGGPHAGVERGVIVEFV
jgi:hypothetical protein